MSFDPRSYAQGIIASNSQEQKLILLRLQKAQTEAQRIISLLIRDAGCIKAQLFGSVATGRVRNLDFDIDIAIWGGDGLTAQGIALNSDFKIDLVEYERAPDHVKWSIDRVGEDSLRGNQLRDSVID